MFGGDRVCLAGALALAAFVPSSARAGGHYVPGWGPHAQGRAGAFTAKADDPTALVHNVAGVAKLDGTHVYVGANFLRLSQQFTRLGSYEDTGEGEDYIGEAYPTVENEADPSIGFAGFQAIPTIVVTTDFGQPQLPVRWVFGVFAPQGFSSRDYAEFHDLPGVTDPAPGPQRYDVFYQTGVAAYPSVGAAWRVLPGLDVGARFSWGFATIHTKKVVWAIRNYEEYNEKDSVFDVKTSDGWVPSFALSALYRPTPFLELGAHYHSASKIRSKGEGSATSGNALPTEASTSPVPDEYARCAPGGEVGAIKTCINFNLPALATLGGRYIWRDGAGRERADLELDVRWENWAQASTTVSFADGMDGSGQFLNESSISHGFVDVFSVRLGGSYRATEAITARGGVAYDTSTAPVSWTRLDADGKERATFAAGIAYSGERYRIDAGAGYVWEPTRTVSHDCQEPAGPSVGSVGCSGMGDTPVPDREAPDPGQPKQGPLNVVESPFNAGKYVSSYVMFSLGVTYAF